MSITIKQKILTKNDCYKSGRTITPNSMQLHTIGTAQNTALSLAEYWNQPGIQACVHYCIDAETENLVYQFLPDKCRSWADAGHGNNNSITVELMESDYMKYTGGANYTITNEAKFKADITRAYNTAVQFFAMKCKEYGWNPQEKMANGLYRVYSHDEGRRLGLSSAHVDPTHIWSRYGWTMDKFRADVAQAMKGYIIPITPDEQPLYRVRKSWSDEKSQIFAGTLDGAKAIVNQNEGYYVYDKSGKMVYGKTDAQSSAAPTTTTKPPYKVRKSWNDIDSQIGSFDILANAKIAANQKAGFAVYDANGVEVYRSPMTEVQKKNREMLDSLPDYKGLPDSQADYINKVAEICVKLYPYTKILPSVVISQAFLENGGGTASDALILTKNNNLVGIKSSLLTESWREYSVWDGRSIKKNTPEVYNGVATRIDDYFRVYSNYAESLLDYEMFLSWAKEGGQYKYRAVVGMTDPKETITYIHNKGYATSLTYSDNVMRIINQYNLTKYDREVGVNNSMAKEVQYYRVATDYKNNTYVGQVGAFTNKDNAINEAKKRGSKYKVYSPDGQVIYSAPSQKKIYAVRRTLKDVDSQIGLFSSLENARKLADQTWGFNVYNIETNKPVYKPVLMNWQKMCASAIKLGEEMLKDLNDGHQWEYAASGEKTFAKARKKGNYKVNCSGGVYWIMCDTGIFPDRSVLNWYGCKGGIRWLNNHAEADFKKYFDVIYVGNKTVVQCIKDGTLHPGDIITYMNISHTNMYLGNIGGVETSFDSGHNNCVGSGNGAKFKRWVCPLTCGSQKIAYIMRVKENASSSSTQYRVQAGSYLIHDNANAMLAKVKRKGFDAKIVVVDGEYVVQLGLFGVKSNADALAKKVTDAGIASIVVKL